MPIKRKLAKQFNGWDTLVSISRDAIRLVQQPLTSHGWINLISRELEIDIEMANNIFLELLGDDLFLFVRMVDKKPIYINDRTPEFKRYMWFGDIY